MTGDIDIFYERTKENVEVLYTALKEFWEGKVPGIENHTEFLKKGAIIQFGRPPNRIDLINDISGVIFEKAWPNCTLEELEIKDQKYLVCYIGLRELIKNKQNANRFKDLEDLKYLTALNKKK